jgi:hypothetical protein
MYGMYMSVMPFTSIVFSHLFKKGRHMRDRQRDRETERQRERRRERERETARARARERERVVFRYIN